MKPASKHGLITINKNWFIVGMESAISFPKISTIGKEADNSSQTWSSSPRIRCRWLFSLAWSNFSDCWRAAHLLSTSLSICVCLWRVTSSNCLDCVSSCSANWAYKTDRFVRWTELFFDFTIKSIKLTLRRWICRRCSRFSSSSWRACFRTSSCPETRTQVISFSRSRSWLS